MKFVAVTLIATTFCAQIVCTAEGACWRNLSSAEGDAYRDCCTGESSEAADYDDEDIFCCDTPVAAEEEAVKIALGLSAVVATIFMAWIFLSSSCTVNH